jgi:hypothetical protein
MRVVMKFSRVPLHHHWKITTFGFNKRRETRTTIIQDLNQKTGLPLRDAACLRYDILSQMPHTESDRHSTPLHKPMASASDSQCVAFIDPFCTALLCGSPYTFNMTPRRWRQTKRGWNWCLLLKSATPSLILFFLVFYPYYLFSFVDVYCSTSCILAAIVSEIIIIRFMI